VSHASKAKFPLSSLRGGPKKAVFQDHMSGSIKYYI